MKHFEKGTPQNLRHAFSRAFYERVQFIIFTVHPTASVPLRAPASNQNFAPKSLLHVLLRHAPRPDDQLFEINVAKLRPGRDKHFPRLLWCFRSYRKRCQHG